MKFLSGSLLLLLTLISTNLCLLSTADSYPPSISPSPSPLSSSPITPPPPPIPPPPPPIPPPPPPPIPPPSTTPQTSPSDPQEKQMSNIVDALVGAGDFEGWATFLSAVNPLTFPLRATLFIPNNDALSNIPPATASGISLDPSIVAYHIIPQHLTFSELQEFPIHSRIPTLLPSNFILITSTSTNYDSSSKNFTIDDAEITHPDLYISSAFSVHGVSKVLDYKLYGGINITFIEEEALKPKKKKTKKKKKKTKTKKKKKYHDPPPAPGPSTAPSSSSSVFAMVLLILRIVLSF